MLILSKVWQTSCAAMITSWFGPSCCPIEFIWHVKPAVAFIQLVCKGRIIPVLTRRWFLLSLPSSLCALPAVPPFSCSPSSFFPASAYISVCTSWQRGRFITLSCLLSPCWSACFFFICAAFNSPLIHDLSGKVLIHFISTTLVTQKFIVYSLLPQCCLASLKKSQTMHSFIFPCLDAIRFAAYCVGPGGQRCGLSHLMVYLSFMLSKHSSSVLSPLVGQVIALITAFMQHFYIT